MAALTHDIGYTDARNRVTVAFRCILAIPHVLVVGVWGYFVQLLAVIQWFIVLFTGQRNRGLWDLEWAYLGYYGRVQAYEYLMYDPYPPFGTDPGPAPVRTALDYDAPADRLTNGLRLIWAIPALFLAIIFGIAAFFVAVVSWFAIVITGRHPRGQFDFVFSVLRFNMQVQAYVLLMTDSYPKYASVTATNAVPAPVPGTPLPPPPPPADRF